MSLSLIAVFIPILLMGGIVGRFFREFAVTLSVAILVSMVVSLTTTPMLCSLLFTKARATAAAAHGRLYRFTEMLFDKLLQVYERSLRWVVRDHSVLVLLLFFATIALNALYLTRIPASSPGSRHDHGRHPGLAGLLVPEDERLPAPCGQHRPCRSRRPECRRLCRRLGGSTTGMMFIALQAHRTTQGQHHRHRQPPPPAVSHHQGRPNLPHGRPGPAHRRPSVQLAVSVLAPRPIPPPISSSGSRSSSAR